MGWSLQIDRLTAFKSEHGNDMISTSQSNVSTIVTLSSVPQMGMRLKELLTVPSNPVLEERLIIIDQT